MRSKELTSRIMSSIKSKDTKPEKILGSSIWKTGLRYRKHYKIKGKPDFVFVSKRVAIFCDGDFWHGNNWKIRGLNSFAEELDSYSEFWKNKIKRNVERDKEVEKELRKQGWTVIRFWESDILKNPERCAKIVFNYIKKLID